MNPYQVPPHKQNSTYGDFFKGPVLFITEGLFKNFFCKHKFALSDGTIIKISKLNYIRLQTKEEFLSGQKEFEIIAPLEKVKVVTGNISSYNIKNMSAAEFHYYRKLYN